MAASGGSTYLYKPKFQFRDGKFFWLWKWFNESGPITYRVGPYDTLDAAFNRANWGP